MFLYFPLSIFEIENPDVFFLLFCLNILFIIVYAVLFIWFLVYFLSIRNGDLDAMPTFTRIIQKISINIFDFVLYRIIPIYAFDLLSREVMKAWLNEKADYVGAEKKKHPFKTFLIILFSLILIGGLVVLILYYFGYIKF